MPTVLQLDGLRVVIYLNDHRPAHVHVLGVAGEAVFELNCPNGPVTVREAFGLDWREEGRLRGGLERWIAVLCERWDDSWL